MTGVLRAELLKQRTTRTTFGVTVGLLVLVCFVVLLHGFALPVSQTGRSGQMRIFGWGELGALFAALLGALSITGELRHGTIRPTFLATPSRRRVLAAKLVAVALAGVGFGAVAEALAIGLGSAALSARGIPIRLDGSDYVQLVVGGVVAAALWAPLGLGLGALVRNQVATLIGLCAWLLFVENLLIGQLPAVARFLPGAAAAAIGGSTITGEVPTDPPLLAPVLGALLLVVYAAAATVAGMVATDRRDLP
jgi:ABC-2 type transport system permease protein